MAGDTIRLNLTQQGTDVSGPLAYLLTEKDSNTGTLSGQMRGDTLIADYTFQSEGEESVRLEEARRLLESRAVSSITEVAARVGYQDASSFARGFRARFGKLPSELLES